MISFNAFVLARASLDSVEVQSISNVLTSKSESGVLFSGKLIAGNANTRQHRSSLKITCSKVGMDALITDFLSNPETEYTMTTEVPTNIFGETKNTSHLVKIRSITQEGKSLVSGLSSYIVIVVSV